VANKRIDELTAATPVIGDFVATTGVGGPATKATVQQAASAGLRLDTAVIETYTGTNYVPYTYAVTPGFPTSCNGVLTAVNTAGVTVERYNLTGAGLVTLTQSNLVGVAGTYNPTSMASLTSLSAPILVYVGGNYQPSSMASLTTLSAPSLTYVGDIYSPSSMAALTSLSAPLLAYVGSTYQPSGMASLTTLSTPALAFVGGNYSPGNLSSLTSLSALLLAYVGGNYSPGTMASLTTLSTPALAFVGSSFNPYTMAALTNISAPALVYVGSTFNAQNMASLTTLSTPLLAYVGSNYQPNGMASLATISLPSLTSVGVNIARTAYDLGRLAPYSLAALTSFTIPVIEVIGSLSGASISFVTGTAALSTFTLGSTLQRVEGNVIMTSCALLVASVDGILVRLAALDGTGLTTAYSTKTVTITGTSATPSATGLAAKATLVARGCTVTHN